MALCPSLPSHSQPLSPFSTVLQGTISVQTVASFCALRSGTYITPITHSSTLHSVCCFPLLSGTCLFNFILITISEGSDPSCLLFPTPSSTVHDTELALVPYFSPMSANIKQLLVQKWVSGTFVALRCSGGYGKLHTREKAHIGQAGKERCRELPESLEVEGGRGKQCSGERLKVVAWWNYVWPFAVTSKAGSSHFSESVVAAIYLLHLGLR